MEVDKIVQHDVAKPFPLPDECIDVVITSPPYWGLRDYGKDVRSIFGGDPECKHKWVEEKTGLIHENRNFQEGTQEEVVGQKGTTWIRKYDEISSGFCQKCGAYKCQLGLEFHPQMYVDHLVMICREIKRVLKKTGSFYLNLGDTFYGSAQGYGASKKSKTGFQDVTKGFYASSKQKPPMLNKWPGKWLKPKQLMLIPSRVAIALQEDGWILRNDIIWKKLNPLPSSVKDRLNTTFEHVFHFVKNRRYYYDLDSIRIPHKTSVQDLERRINADRSGTTSTKKNLDVLVGGPQFSTEGPKYSYDSPILEYDSKYKNGTHGQTPQGFTRVQSIAKERVQSRKDAKKLFPNDPKKQQEYINFIHDHGGDPRGRNPGDIIEENMKSEASSRGYSEHSASRTVTHLHQVGKNYSKSELGKNPGDIMSVAETYGKDKQPGKKGRKRDSVLITNRPSDYFGHPSGKNPGDVIKWDDDEQYPRSIMKFGRGQTTESLHRDGNGVYHPKGKNPGDIYLSPKYNGTSGHSNRQGLNRKLDTVTIKAYKEYQEPIAKYLKQNIKKKHKPILDETFGKHKWKHWIRTDLSGAALPGVEDWFKLKEIIGFDDTFDDKIYEVQKSNVPVFQPGSNPGDIIQFDEEYWWDFILGKAHSNRFYKKAYEIMKEWMIKNNCFDYEMFYEWYKKEFEGKWESGNLKKGKANYLSDEKRLPFPKPETRFLGDVPSDFWEICTSPFTGYNPDLEHFAVFPEALLIKPLKSSCPQMVCKKCGKPQKKVVKSGGYDEAFNIRVRDVKEGRIKHTDRKASEKEVKNYDEEAYVSKVKKHVIASGCNCNAGFRPGVVLDPFCGRGTVGKVAKKLGLHYILFDIKPEYCELARLYIGGQKHKIPKEQSNLDVFL